MKQQINEIRRMQHLAGLITESQLNELSPELKQRAYNQANNQVDQLSRKDGNIGLTNTRTKQTAVFDKHINPTLQPIGDKIAKKINPGYKCIMVKSAGMNGVLIYFTEFEQRDADIIIIVSDKEGYEVDKGKELLKNVGKDFDAFIEKVRQSEVTGLNKEKQQESIEQAVNEALRRYRKCKLNENNTMYYIHDEEGMEEPIGPFNMGQAKQELAKHGRGWKLIDAETAKELWSHLEDEEQQELNEGLAIKTVINAVQAALAKGSTVEVNGKEVISVVPLAGRFKTSNGGMIKLEDVKNIEIDGKPINLEMPYIDQSVPPPSKNWDPFKSYQQPYNNRDYYRDSLDAD